MARAGYDRGMTGFLADDILPAAPEGLTTLHDREYRVRSYRAGEHEMVIHGAVRDQKPPGQYTPDDPDPLTIHHMQVELRVSFPALEITAAEVLFDTHPHTACPAVADRYGELVGLSIARGFINRVRELFGGPRGCTHVTALLLAMAPVAVQSTWSMRTTASRPTGPAGQPPMQSAVERERMWTGNVGTCHVWADDGEHVAALRA